jgi:hypothetical protein
VSKKRNSWQASHQRKIAEQRKASELELTGELKQSIAQLVRAVEFSGAQGGTCCLRALTGSIVLDRFNIEHSIVLGGLLYRAGPGIYDTLAWAEDRDNKGHYPGLFHCWLEAGTDIIDFSCGDWQQINDHNSDMVVNPLNLPPIEWTCPPPRYLWQPRTSLLKWSAPPYGPNLGETWYTPLAEGDRAIFDDVTEQYRPMITDAVDKVFIKFHLPVFKMFRNAEDRADYMKENPGTFVLIE